MLVPSLFACLILLAALDAGCPNKMERKKLPNTKLPSVMPAGVFETTGLINTNALKHERIKKITGQIDKPISAKLEAKKKVFLSKCLRKFYSLSGSQIRQHSLR